MALPFALVFYYLPHAAIWSDTYWTIVLHEFCVVIGAYAAAPNGFQLQLVSLRVRQLGHLLIRPPTGILRLYSATQHKLVVHTVHMLLESYKYG